MKIRAQIDTENVRGLLLINGGGAIALLAFLPFALDMEDSEILAKSILFALLCYQTGLVLAVAHNRMRRICSLLYEATYTASPRLPLEPCTKFGHTFSEPCVCIRSTVFMWASLAAFVVGGLLVFWGGICVIGK